MSKRRAFMRRLDGLMSSPMNDPAALVVVPPVELAAPDIARWRAGNTGVDHVHRLRADAPGPVVHVQALTHGNEICGAIALDWLLQQVQAHPPSTWCKESTAAVSSQCVRMHCMEPYCS